MCNISVGYWLCDDKEDKLNFRQFVKYCSQKGIDLVKTELGPEMMSDPLKPPGFSLFIHKLNDLIVDTEAGDETAAERLATYERWAALHPEVDIIDPLPFTRLLLDRVSMSKLIEKTCLALDDSIFFIPPFCKLTTADIDGTNAGVQTLRQNGLEFPIICKPMMAESHDIVVITREQGLPYAPVPCLAQTFIAHSQLLYKIYVLGDQLFCVERPSIPDPNELAGMGPVLRFNTASLGKGPPSAFDPDRKKIFVSDQNVLLNGFNVPSKTAPRISGPYINGTTMNGNGTSNYNTQQNGFTTTTTTNGLSLNYRPSSKAIQVLATALRAELNLELFGADVIVDAVTGRLACVDVNAFPGYKGVPDFFGEFASFLTRRARNEVCAESKMPIFIS